MHAPRDWMVWHFTRLDYLVEIIRDGRLMCDDHVTPRAGSVVNAEVKALRPQRIINAPGYPAGRRVSQHVPFYIAAKSPMLYVVSRKFPQAVVDSLVFLGVQIEDIIYARLEWVASDGNAATAVTQFSGDVDRLGTFVDFALLGERDWYNAPADTGRMSRAADQLCTTDPERVTDYVQRWTERKGRMFTTEHIAIALDRVANRPQHEFAAAN